MTRFRRFVRIAGVLPLALAASACWRHSDSESYRWAGDIPDGATVHLRNANGAIVVKPADGEQTNIVGSRRWRGRTNLTFVSKHVGNDVYVCAVYGNSGRCDESGYRAGRPRRFMWFFRSPFSGDARATLTAELPPGVKIDAQTTSGSVSITGARAGGLARSVNGGISVRESAGSFIAETVNGSVRVALDSLDDRDAVQLETVNGSVRVELPETFAGDVNLSTVNGTVRTDFPITASAGRFSARSLVGRVGEGSQSLRIKTVNGSVSIRQAGQVVVDER